MNPTPPPLPVASAVAIPPVTLDAAGNIAEDISCRRCSYNLRSLSLQGRCPECGTAVGRSIHGDFLRFSDPDWVQKLASGMNWIVAAIVIAFLAGCSVTFAGSVFQKMSSARWTFLALPGFQYLIGLVGLIGYWKVTSPDPAAQKDPLTSARNLIRITQTGNYIFTPIQLYLQMAGSWIAIVASVIVGVCGIVSVFAVFVYGRQLALRIPDDKMARHCRIVMWGLAVITIVAAAVGIIALIQAPAAWTPVTPTTSSAPANVFQANVTINSPGTGATPPTAPMPFAGAPGGFAGFTSVMCVLGGGSLIFGLWSLSILLRMRRALNEAATNARGTWASTLIASDPTIVRTVRPAR